MRRGRGIVATLLIAFGLFSLLSVYSSGTGQVGQFVAYWLDRSFGWAAGAPALFVIWLGFYVFRPRDGWRLLRRSAGFGALLIVLLTVLHLFGRISDWPGDWSPREELLYLEPWGGLLGALLAGSSMKFLGLFGTALVLAVLIILSWILLVDTTITQLFDSVSARFSLGRVRDKGRATAGFKAKPKGRARRRWGRKSRTDDAVEQTAAAVEITEQTAGPESFRGKTKAKASSREVASEEERDDVPLKPSVNDYKLPDVSMLDKPPATKRRGTAEDEGQARQLEETLASFGIDAQVVSISRGPTVTRYEVQPPPGIKVSRIVGLADDISLNLAAAGVRIEAPVPGKSVVGIEVPNKETSPVVLREILEANEFRRSKSPLTVALGRDIAGKPLVADLQKLLHLLIAGATGSGKSVCLNSLITSLLYKADPDEVKFLMIDPKRVELSVYDGIPHLITPVVTDPREAASALRWAVKEMERRYQLLSKAGVRNLDGYNRSRRKPEGGDEFVPYLVIIIDELADLMLVASADVENSIVRLAQMARAAGIYLIIATQRPSVDVITGLIKANVPSRLAFAVSSQVDSRTILDMGGAERLLGRGDMLFYPIGAPKPVRAQGAWISDAEVEAVADAWRAQGEPTYIEDVIEPAATEGGDDAEVEDELFDEAVALVREQGHASVSMLQRRFRIGYARAARLIDVMEVKGIVGPYQGSKPREVIGIDGVVRQ